MPNLTKDQIQKIFLSALLMMMLIYGYFSFLIGPLNKSETRNKAAIEALDQQLAQARTKILRTRNLQEEARVAGETLAAINDQIPEGAPIAWFPPRMRAFFDRHNIKETLVRPGPTEKPAEPELANYKNVNWVIDASLAKFIPLSLALAGLENDEMLLEITHLQINTLPENLEEQRVSINVITLLK
jgi:hypothetical protein